MSAIHPSAPVSLPKAKALNCPELANPTRQTLHLRGAKVLAPEPVKGVLTESGALKIPGLQASKAYLRAAELRRRADAAAENLRRSRAGDSFKAIALTAVAHAGVIIAVGAMAISAPYVVPPGGSAHASVPSGAMKEDLTKLSRTLNRRAAEDHGIARLVASQHRADVTMASSEAEASPLPAAMLGTGSFEPSVQFPEGRDAGITLFGTPLEAKVLGVIADVSGSAAELLPSVIREVDQHAGQSPVVFVNHTILREFAEGEATALTPVVATDVAPSREGLPTPYTFLWGELPRVAGPSSMDQVIEIFKTRPDCHLAVGGENRIAAAFDYLISQKVDAIYIYSDFEDYTDLAAAQAWGQKLVAAKVRVYVQPVSRRTESLELIASQMVKPSQGRELPPLVEPEGEVVKLSWVKLAASY